MSTAEVPMSFVHTPDMKFRAARNYVHSTDLYEELLRGAEAAGLDIDGKIELKMRRLLRKQPEFRYVRSPENLSKDAPVEFSLSAAGVLWRGTVCERDAPVVNRKSYDEAPIWMHAVPEGRTVRLDQETGMRPIEVVAALGVLLHRRQFPIAQDRKWYLARLDLLRPLVAHDARTVCLELTRNLGATMTRSAVSTVDGLIGHLDFILGPT
jgi:hypothetical protein